jgi:hypothetical protein
MKVGADALQYLVLHVADKKTFLQYSQNTQHEQVYQNNKLILKKNLYQISSKGLFVTLVW